MIATDFAYYQPETLAELAQAVARAGERTFLFYGGGSEILSMARAGSIAPEAVIDLRAICANSGRSAARHDCPPQGV